MSTIQSPTKGVILAAGRGTRMGPLTAHRPKPMLPLANRPTLAWIIAGLRHMGITRILIVHGYLSEVIESYFKTGSAWGVELDYVLQGQATGTATAAGLAASFTGTEPFVLCWGDNLACIPCIAS